METSIAEAVAIIAADNQSGAAEIAEDAANVLLLQASSDSAHNAEDLRRGLLEVGWALIQSHPVMAPLVNLVNGVLWKVDNDPTVQAIRRSVNEAVMEFKRRLRVHEVAIAESSLALIPDGATVLTNGRSSTVRAALTHAQRSGRRFRVVCAEGRPGCEGRLLARELAEGGIAVTLVTDALAIARVPEMQLVLVGTDYLTGNWLVNKVGTRGIALAAQVDGVPLYALCSSEKFLPAGYTPPSENQHASAEVWAEAPRNIAIENYYFDYTPLTQVAGIVTEQGVQPTAGIEAWIAATKLHAALKQPYLRHVGK